VERICPKCQKPLKDGDRVKAVVLSIFRQISSSVAYAIDKPYDCLSLEHVDCENPQAD
jgi:hypothetical protein